MRDFLSRRISDLKYKKWLAPKSNDDYQDEVKNAGQVIELVQKTMQKTDIDLEQKFKAMEQEMREMKKELKDMKGANNTIRRCVSPNGV